MTVARTRRTALVEIEHRRGGYDAAVVDDTLPGEALATIVAMLRRDERPCLAVGLCSSGREEDRRRAVAAGVMELIPMPHRVETVLDAVERCAAATTCLRARIDGNESVSFARLPQRRPPHQGISDRGPCRRGDLERRSESLARCYGLTERELSVLRFIAMGYRYAEVAAELTLAPRTVKMHAMNLRRKIGASDRLGLVRKIYQGLG